VEQGRAAIRSADPLIRSGGGAGGAASLSSIPPEIRADDPILRPLKTALAVGTLVEGDMGKALGVDNKWAYNIVKQVGNYGEIWNQNIAPLGVPRGLNNLWTKGGLQYAPPIR
jgi:hypothetical protein